MSNLRHWTAKGGDRCCNCGAVLPEEQGGGWGSSLSMPDLHWLARAKLLLCDNCHLLEKELITQSGTCTHPLRQAHYLTMARRKYT